MKSKFVLSALCLLVSALIFSGCASFEQTAYRSLGTTTTLVDGAMNGWGDWVRAGQATAGDEAQVRAAYEHYQLAMAAARSTVLATTADSATESDLERALAAVDAASAALVQLISQLHEAGNRDQGRGAREQ
ncbi:MAG: hypothetical protein ACYC23_19795 [Limisphaerales bacterium]